MTTLTIPSISPQKLSRIKSSARANHRSLEEEVLRLIDVALNVETTPLITVLPEKHTGVGSFFADVAKRRKLTTDMVDSVIESRDRTLAEPRELLS